MASNKDELKMEVDMSEHKSGGAKPAIAERLEKDAASLQKKRSSLSKEDVETKLKEAEERRQKELEKKIETAKELEGTRGKIDPKAAAKDAPPQGTELPNSPTNDGDKNSAKKK